MTSDNINIKEEWKEISINKNYLVSNYGRVKSLPRYEEIYSGVYNTYKRKRHGRILKLINTSVGYTAVSINKKQIHVHRLVAVAFIENKNNKPQVNHKDGDKTNNFIGNLEWATQSENTKHAYSELGMKNSQQGKFGEDHGKSKKVMQLNVAGDLIRIWGSGMDAVRELGFESSEISRCCKGIRNTHKGFIWMFYEKD